MKQMKRFSWVSLSLTLGLCLLFCQAVTGETVRIMTFNVRSCHGLEGDAIDTQQVVDVIAAEKPDVVGIQEMDQKNDRCGKREILKELATALQMEYAYAPAISYRGGYYGIGSLFGTKPIHSYNIPLPGKEEKRTLQVTEFESFVFFNTHLSLTEESRLESLEIIAKEQAKFRKPIFIVGDFNATPDEKTMAGFLKMGWKKISPDAFTFPADKPNCQIDYVLMLNAPNAKVKSAKVVEAPRASDHRPVVVEVSFAE